MDNGPSSRAACFDDLVATTDRDRSSSPRPSSPASRDSVSPVDMDVDNLGSDLGDSHSGHPGRGESSGGDGSDDGSDASSESSFDSDPSSSDPSSESEDDDVPVRNVLADYEDEILVYCKRDLGHEKLILCSFCAQRLQNMNALCANPLCPLVRKRLRRSVKSKRIVVETVELRRHFEEILRAHLDFLSLPPSMRFKYANMGFPFVISSGGKPKRKVWKLLSRRIHSWLEELLRVPYVFDCRQGRVQVTLSVYCSQMDAAAAASVYGMVGWMGYNGCFFCMHPGDRTHGKMVFPLLRNSELRSEVPGDRFCVFEDAAASRNGFRDDTPWLHLCPPTRLVIDGLHSLQEGVQKDWMADSLATTGRPGLRLSRNGKRFLSELNDTTFPHGSAKVFTGIHEDMGKLTGSESEMIFVAIFAPLSFEMTAFEDPYTGSLYACMSLVVRLLQSQQMNRVTIERLADLISSVIRSVSESFGDRFSTFKIHLLEHLPYFLRTVGCPYELGTASLEAAYRQMKNIVPHANTCRQGGISLTNHAASTVLLEEIKRRAELDSVCCIQYLAEQRPTFLDNMMIERISLLGNVYVSPSDRYRAPRRVNLDLVDATLLLRAAAPGYDELFKRVLTNGYLFESYFFPNKNRKESQRCWVIAIDQNGNLRPARFELCGVHQRAQSVCVLSFFPTVDPFERIRNSLLQRRTVMPVFHTPTHDNICNLLGACSDMNEIYFEIVDNQGDRQVVQTENVKAPAQICSFNGRTFIINLKAKIYHE